ncbi:MAG: dTDP-4-dehydrorhamnose reductase [Candidatus Saganbacteria bacterium]|uniref:dTDP-4-dehydrorhamnose reductase n=1 Tax=Candidatus Saganbacteria bacterium TaxID=2575572 RepID=A0A833L2R9_UNCSA|nr:MAG: dTDP-4-dehydrorhamnose reductase [Candidatus Saganbacteria bacterium]
MKIAIIGADGQLGSDLLKVIPQKDQIPLTIKEINICDFDAASRVLLKNKPDLIINTAGYHRVDDCEDNDLEACKVNAHGAKNLSIISNKINSALVHISTDYVFSGEKGTPYNESDAPDPKTAYGISKLAGEQFIKYICKKYYIIRTSGLYGESGCMGKGGGNFVENMMAKAKTGEKMKVVSDEIISPTYTKDLADKIYELIGKNIYGLYHITNEGQCSWFEFADSIFKLIKKEAAIEKISAGEYITKAKRPKYSVLENSRLEKAGLSPMRNWREALRAYLTAK